MAKMFGKHKHTYFNSCRLGCCYRDIPKSSVKREEKTAWIREADEEMAHGTYCGDYYCPECGGGEDLDYNDASDLDGIKGVWTDARGVFDGL